MSVQDKGIVRRPGATRREIYAPIIAEVIRQHLLTDDNGALVIPADMKPIRAALKERCPIYPKKYYPYRIWLDEIRVQLGLRRPVPGRGRPTKRAIELMLPNIAQAELFSEITPELRLIEVVIRAKMAGRSAATIQAAAKELLSYPVVVRIMSLSGQGKLPAEILQYLLADEKKARALAAAESKPGENPNAASPA